MGWGLDDRLKIEENYAAGIALRSVNLSQTLLDSMV